jgi:hypothetical protein
MAMKSAAFQPSTLDRGSSTRRLLRLLFDPESGGDVSLRRQCLSVHNELLLLLLPEETAEDELRMSCPMPRTFRRLFLQ